jgi:hypothetical protein
MKKNLLLRIIWIVAFLSILIGAIGSLILTLHAGNRNKSVFLPVLFVIWVLSPYVALTASTLKPKNQSITSRIVLYVTAIIISLYPLLGYSGILNLPNAKHAAIFLITPLISWIIIVIVSIIILRWKKRGMQN